MKNIHNFEAFSNTIEDEDNFVDKYAKYVGVKDAKPKEEDETLSNNITFDSPEGIKFFNDLKKKWRVKTDKDSTSKLEEYKFPIEAKNDLESIGIDWFHIERNRDRDDEHYGKKCLVFIYYIK
jgi:hypothetical protein